MRARVSWGCSLRLLLGLALLAGPASAVRFDWVRVGDPGNAADTASNCFAANCGSVAYEYYISKYEVTNAQYAEFLNAKAASDPNGLYNEYMGLDTGFGGITRNGSSGSYTYTVMAGFANKPIAYVSFWDAVRFTNWLANGQGSSDTETGAYTLTPAWITANSVTRTWGATTFLPSENEWYKAAYYGGGGVYFDFPTGTNAVTECVAPGEDTGNSANCYLPPGTLTDVGSYALSESPSGTYDQGGNVWEWNETIVGSYPGRSFRGGDWSGGEISLDKSHRECFLQIYCEHALIGFRVASLPEPATIGPALAVLLGLAWRRRRS